MLFSEISAFVQQKGRRALRTHVEWKGDPSEGYGVKPDLSK